MSESQLAQELRRARQMLRARGLNGWGAWPRVDGVAIRSGWCCSACGWATSLSCKRTVGLRHREHSEFPRWPCLVQVVKRGGCSRLVSEPHAPRALRVDSDGVTLNSFSGSTSVSLSAANGIAAQLGRPAVAPVVAPVVAPARNADLGVPPLWARTASLLHFAPAAPAGADLDDLQQLAGVWCPRSEQELRCWRGLRLFSRVEAISPHDSALPLLVRALRAPTFRVKRFLTEAVMGLLIAGQNARAELPPFLAVRCLSISTAFAPTTPESHTLADDDDAEFVREEENDLEDEDDLHHELDPSAVEGDSDRHGGELSGQEARRRCVARTPFSPYGPQRLGIRRLSAQSWTPRTWRQYASEVCGVFLLCAQWLRDPEALYLLDFVVHHLNSDEAANATEEEDYAVLARLAEELAWFFVRWVIRDSTGTFVRDFLRARALRAQLPPPTSRVLQQKPPRLLHLPHAHPTRLSSRRSNSRCFWVIGPP